MLVIPAIDLLEGRCVRLYQGRFEQVTSYSDDPVAMARHWQDIGAEWLHVVDLEGARSGEPKQLEVVREIRRAIGGGIELGGGLRTMAAIEQAVEVADRVIVGTAAIKDPRLVRDAVAAFGSRIAVAIDSRDGLVATDGWESGTARTAPEVAAEMRDLGVQTVIFTSIDVDATMAGPNLKAIQQMREVEGISLIASGGVGTIAHLRLLARLRVDGCIVGKALYEGTVDLARALHEVEEGTERHEW